MSRVWVAMSGGVDSGVAAAEMLRQGHDVTGVTMRLLESPCAPEDDPVQAAASVCRSLDIPHHVLDARELFESAVIHPYAAGYAGGITPNPCIACNTLVKFGWLLDRALEGGATVLATGHYARIRTMGSELRVARAVDLEKDQSYFLYDLDRKALQHAAFPLGEWSKSRVRERARELDLEVAHRPESQEACFAGPGGTSRIVASLEPEAARPGEIVGSDGSVLGTHSGIASYTIGQRKGLGIGGLAEPLFVIAVDAANNRIVVGPESDLNVTHVCATSAIPGFEDGMACEAVVRYRMDPVPARVFGHDGGIEVRFDRRVRAVAPGQSVVCYEHDTIVAGGEITCAS